MRSSLCHALLASLLAAACGGDEAAPAADGPPPPALVRVAEVGPGNLTESWTSLAEVEAMYRAELASGAAGPVTSVTLREGGRVTKGAAIVVVDESLARARAQAAEAAVVEARAELERRERALARREGVGGDVLSEEELFEAANSVQAQTARLQAAEAAEAEARAQLRRHRVSAPFDGVLTRRLVDEGDWVNVGTPVAEAVSTEQVEARVSVPLSLARQLALGTEVQLNGGAAFVEAVVPALDASTRTALVRLTPAEGHSLVPGEAVPVALPVSWEGVGVTVPRDALMVDPKETLVLGVVQGAEGLVAESVVVEVLATSGDMALVATDALHAGDRVVTRGNERVRPGQALKVEGESP